MAAWYRTGMNGFPIDLKKAMYWARKAKTDLEWENEAIKEIRKIKKAKEDAGFSIIDSICGLLESIFLD